MALTKEPIFLPQTNDTASPYRPLALSPWRPVFDKYGELADSSTVRKYSSRDLATQVGEYSVARLQRQMERERGDKLDDELSRTALLALDATIADQSSRNSRYDTLETQSHLRAAYPDDAEAILYGTTPPEVLAKTLIENHTLITSLEVARYTHVGQWRLKDNINEDVPSALTDARLDAKELSDVPKYKIKSFELSKRWVLAERKRTIMSAMGGQALLVMRLNFLIDGKSGALDSTIAMHIAQERKKQFERKAGGYNFDAENELLRDAFDDTYVRSGNEVPFIVPLQTGYYIWSPEAHELEKKREAAKKLAQQARAAEQRALFAQLDAQ
ncbi:MAG: hypothetical protein WAS27_04340 [Candidatus Saccharimonadales bacterium]